MSRLLLCTDMDRTVIPNGVQPEVPDARKRLARLCSLSDVSLVYVTGRHKELVAQAIKNYALPEADFIISDVGTKIYQTDRNAWREIEVWNQEISQDWRGMDYLQIKRLFDDITNLNLQEVSKQNTHKLSYYLPLQLNKDEIIDRMETRLDKAGINASLIWSIDEAKGIGLLDVLPKNATKLHAIEFLYRQLDYFIDEVVFAGDSGNDLPVLCSPIASVLVANATEEVKRTALNVSVQKGHQDKLYLAGENYAAGVLEGVAHFLPDFAIDRGA